MGALYVALMQDFGWTLEQVDALAWTDIDFVMLGWKRHPPLAAMVAGFLGVKPEKKERANRENMKELAKFIGG